jgi:hypothetical protein
MTTITTARDALAAWDRGEPVQTVEMGGIGPGYEQAIQILAFELIREAGPLPKPNAEGRYDLSGWGEAVVARLDETCGFSGAQVGAAKGLAFHGLLKGWAALLAEVEPDRRILVSRSFPPAPPSPAPDGAPGGKEGR